MFVPRRLLVRLPVLLAALGVGYAVSRHWPNDQSLRVVLGDTAPSVVEVRVRYAEHGRPSDERDDWAREVTFRYAPGRAPRMVNHEARLANGDYDVEIDIGLVTTTGPARAARTVTIERRVELGGAGTTASVDVSGAVRDSLAETAPPP